jgi:hypothetical protein
MTEASKKMKEEADLTNEILYGKKSSKKTTETSEEKPKKSGGELEILNGKTVKPEKINKLSKEDQEDADMVNEMLGNKKSTKPVKGSKLSKEDQEDYDNVNDLLGGGKKKKSEPVADGLEEKKPGKKFDRQEYFGL